MRVAAVIPDPSQRLSPDLYLRVRAWMLEHDPDMARMIAWSSASTGLPDTPERMAAEIIWIILCAGRSAQAARTIEAKVWRALRAGQPVVEAFGYRAKAAAIERAWRERAQDFDALQRVGTGDVSALLRWCKSLPFIGDDTQFQLAKNFGADLCKPDIWLCRLAGLPDRPRRSVDVRFAACMRLCKALAPSCADSLATVDSVLWLACNKGVLQVDAQAGPVHFVPRAITAREIIPSP